jgi:molybdate transport system substrate-binding protein
MDRAPRGWGHLVALVLTLLSVPARGTELLVFAARSTQSALSEVVQAFQEKTGVRVQTSFGASSTLARQIAAGAPADVFLAADEASFERVKQAGQVALGPLQFLSNRLVVVAPRDGSFTMSRTGDLLQASRVATGNPNGVPLGEYAKRWLKGEGLWPALESKLVPAQDSREALRFVETGEVEAAIVYQSDALGSPDLRWVYRVPREKTPPISYPLAKLKHAQGHAADDFLTFLREPEARGVFRRYGFLVVAQ